MAKPTFFETPAAFRAWLERHHAAQSELFLGFYKAGAKKRGITYPQALDEALCFGWIDGVRKRLSDDAWMMRFTPRKAKSYWSTVNIAKAEALKKAGRMAPAGLKAFEARDASGARRYSFENRPQELDGVFRGRLAESPRALAFHEAQPAYYRRAAAFWITSAKQEATRDRRLSQLIEHAEAGRRVPQLVSPARVAKDRATDGKAPDATSPARRSAPTGESASAKKPGRAPGGRRVP